jgi:hypothetical protein
VEYAIVARREGMSRFEALVDACHKRSRPPAVFTCIDDAQRVIGAVAARLGLRRRHAAAGGAAQSGSDVLVSSTAGH